MGRKKTRSAAGVVIDRLLAMRHLKDDGKVVVLKQPDAHLSMNRTHLAKALGVTGQSINKKLALNIAKIGTLEQFAETLLVDSVELYKLILAEEKGK